MKRVLVTGGGGFVGKAILKRLANQGIELVSLAGATTPSCGLWGGNPPEDLADKDAVMKAVAGCDVVFHGGAGGDLGRL